ncbi:MAG: cyclophilin-like fold protein [Nitrososphaeraceae archaeon]
MWNEDSKIKSVSRIQIEIEVKNKGIMRAELIRHSSPLTISSITRNLPISGRIHNNSNTFYYIQTQLSIGAEKQKTCFDKGEIAYMTTNNAICFFVKKIATIPMNKIGRIKDNIKILEQVEPKDIMEIKIDRK